MSTVKPIGKENFEAEILNAKLPALLEFSAPWCTYCRRIAIPLRHMAEDLADELVIGAVNIDEEPELAAQFAVDVIPTLYLFQNGEHGEKLVAPESRAAIEDWIHAQKK